MKLKTSKSAVKRIVKFSSSGKILRKGMSAQHRTTGKSKRTLRNASLNFEVGKSSFRRIKKLIPYR